MVYRYALEYYSAIKKDEIMLFAARWMDPENIILSEANQKGKEKYHMISLHMISCGILKKKKKETRSL